MRVLLLAMPDYVSYAAAHCYPNLGICSIAAHLDDVQVKCLDLRLVRDVEKTVRSLMREFDPDVVGLSAMSFQYRGALRLAGNLKRLKPTVRIVLGGYHATTAYQFIGRLPEERAIDFLAKGESELTFAELTAALRAGDTGYHRIAGLSYWEDGALRHNPLPENIDLAAIRLPARHKRLRNDFYGWGERVDCLETSRGCTLPCTYCSITRMYGRSFREYDFDRILEDVQIMRSQGVEKVFIIDDNITLNVPRFKQLLRRLIDEKIRMKWSVQATVVGIASDEEVSELMHQAGFVNAFLGIEHLSKDVLKYYKKGGVKNTTLRAVGFLRKHQISIIGGFIIGSPEDDRATIRDLVDQIRTLDIDLPYIQILTPYPGTPQRDELIARGLVVNQDDLSTYDGFHSNVRTEHLSRGELAVQQHLAYARLYLDPRLRAGRRIYRGLFSPHVPKTVAGFLAEMARQLGRRVVGPRPGVGTAAAAAAS